MLVWNTYFATTPYCVIVTPLRLRIATTLVPPSINRPKSSFRPEGGFPKMMSWSGFASENGLLEVRVTELLRSVVDG